MSYVGTSGEHLEVNTIAFNRAYSLGKCALAFHVSFLFFLSFISYFQQQTNLGNWILGMMVVAKVSG